MSVQTRLAGRLSKIAVTAEHGTLGCRRRSHAYVQRDEMNFNSFSNNILRTKQVPTQQLGIICDSPPSG